jgi:ribonuclease G
MGKEILINVEHQEKRVAIVRDGRLDEFYVERPQDKTIVGNIYKGTIEAAIASINGAFVDIGMLKKGFLYLSEVDSVTNSSMPKANRKKNRIIRTEWPAGSKKARKSLYRS